MSVVVTTSKKPSDDVLRIAHSVAKELEARLVLRRTDSVADIRRRHAPGGVVVVTREGMFYYHGDGRFFFHPSMAKVRVQSLKLGHGDIAAAAMGLQEGMSVLDCTLGRAADACVASFAVGPSGRVVGVEIDPVVAALTRWGLLRFDPASPALAEAMRRVEVVAADHADYLRDAEAGAFDVVYFDPFFDDSLDGSQAMHGLRAVGHHGGVGEEVLMDARRVARRRVVCKVKRGSVPQEFGTWRAVGGRKSRVEYRVLDTSGEDG